MFWLNEALHNFFAVQRLFVSTTDLNEHICSSSSPTPPAPQAHLLVFLMVLDVPSQTLTGTTYSDACFKTYGCFAKIWAFYLLATLVGVEFNNCLPDWLTDWLTN
jgi:hypothetical protein